MSFLANALLSVRRVVAPGEDLLCFVMVSRRSLLVHMFTCEIPKMAVAAKDVMAFGQDSPTDVNTLHSSEDQIASHYAAT